MNLGERIAQAKREGYEEATKRAIEMAVFNIPYVCKFDNTPARLVGIVIPEEVTPEKHELVQLFNPRSHRYIKVDKTVGGIVGHGKRDGKPYKNIPIVYKSKPKRTIKSPPKPRPSLTDKEVTDAITKETGYRFGGMVKE